MVDENVKKMTGTIDTVRREVPKSLPELERQPIHQALFVLSGVIAIVLAIPSFFVGALSLGALRIGIAYGFINLIFGFLLGFMLLYCYVLGKKRRVLASVLAIIFSFLLFPLEGFLGIFPMMLGLCGGAIGLLRKSRIMPDYITADSTIIDDIFLMYKDGRLIKHYTRRLKPSIDQDILSSMLVAVQDFVKDSFERTTGEDGNLDEMKFGEFKIVIGRGQWIIIAALVLGEGGASLKKQITLAVADIEKRYPDLLKDWNGTLEMLRPLNQHMRDLVDGHYEGKIE